MVPNKFNMIDLDGLDIIESQGVIVPGLYDKLVESIALCRYQCIYNWKFNSIPIPPTYVELDSKEDGVWINDCIVVSQDDTIHIYTLEPDPDPPVINPLDVVSNGIYSVSEGVDGFNPVTVAVESGFPSWLHYFDDEPDDLVGDDGDVGIVGTIENLGLVPIHSSEVTNDIAGQNLSTACNAFDNNQSTFWTTDDRNYTNMYIGYNFNRPMLCNGVSIMPRQWAGVVQIHDFRVEGSNDLSTWDTVFEGEIINNVENAGVWNDFSFNDAVYSAYRLVALSLNTSVTFTIYGLQFNMNNVNMVNVYTKINGHWLLYK